MTNQQQDARTQFNKIVSEFVIQQLSVPTTAQAAATLSQREGYEFRAIRTAEFLFDHAYITLEEVKAVMSARQPTEGFLQAAERIEVLSSDMAAQARASYENVLLTKEMAGRKLNEIIEVDLAQRTYQSLSRSGTSSGKEVTDKEHADNEAYAIRAARTANFLLEHCYCSVQYLQEALAKRQTKEGLLQALERLKIFTPQKAADVRAAYEEILLHNTIKETKLSLFGSDK